SLAGFPANTISFPDSLLSKRTSYHQHSRSLFSTLLITIILFSALLLFQTCSFPDAS
ncbi:hypothetical protein BDZ91DRAFT_680296, partial [Kalaharituber pfeilii]